MGLLPLRFDKHRLAFFAWVSLELTTGRWTVVELLVDSGSNTSGIDARIASENGVGVARLPWGDLTVVGGVTTQPLVSQVRAVLFDDAFSATWIRPLWVLTGNESGLAEGAESGILGLDALDSFGARVALDMPMGLGWIEW